jgi:hypothetical protein
MGKSPAGVEISAARDEVAKRLGIKIRKVVKK